MRKTNEIQIDVTARIDLPLLSRVLTPPQIHALMSGIAQVTAAQQVTWPERKVRGQ